ncbi:hypothetical protein GCM10023187_45090 [Nibrella viscosa]|uniref:Benenodin family lasso peptide n=1 Tax=Nibrella viscosa TaxID=1084524 RepID=A0ABP8KS61_9BACT
MELQNDRKDKKTVIANQEDAAIVATSLPTESVEDVELNEDQLDIISGGGDGSNPFVRG